MSDTVLERGPSPTAKPTRAGPRGYPPGLKIREARPGDGAAIARVHRETAAYYVDLAPELFRMPDDAGLVEFAEPTAADNSPTSLFLVAEAWGRERGATVALCDTWPDSPVSLPFWLHRMRYETRSVRLRKPLDE